MLSGETVYILRFGTMRQIQGWNSAASDRVATKLREKLSSCYWMRQQAVGGVAVVEYTAGVSHIVEIVKRSTAYAAT